MSPDDRIIEAIEVLALTALGSLVAAGLAGALVARTVRRKVGR